MLSPNKRMSIILISFFVSYCFGSHAIAITFEPTYEPAPTPDDVLIIYNSSYTTDYNANGVQDSREIAEYYVSQRPGAHIGSIAAPTTEQINRTQYDTIIKPAIESYLTTSGLKDSIKYIVLAKGIPLKISWSVMGSSILDINYSSVDAAVCLLFQNYDITGVISNPYYKADTNSSKIYRFKPDYFTMMYGVDRGKVLKYLVTRLDGINVNDVKAMIDRATNAPTSTTAGYWILDNDKQQSGYYGDVFDETIEGAYTNLKAFNRNVYPDPLPTDRAIIDQYILTSPGPVIGYNSWGLHANMGNGYITNNPVNPIHLQFDSIANGAIIHTYESYNGVSYADPNITPFGLVSEWINIGGSGGIGNTWEPWTDGVPDTETLFTNYAYGYNFADAAYMSLPFLDWVNTVAGDPLMTIVNDLTPPENVSNLSVSASIESTSFSWTNPIDSDFYGVKIIKNSSHYPQNIDDGTLVYNGTGTSFIDSVIVDNSVYYSIFTYDNVPNYSSTSSNSMVFVEDTIAPVITGLSDDIIVRREKTWIWDSDTENATYRYLIDQNPEGVPIGDYSSVKTAIQSEGDGNYYIHVQARDISGNESEVSTVYVILTNVGPMIINLSNDTTPTKSKTWQWTSDDPDDRYRYIISTSPSLSLSGNYSYIKTISKNSGNGTYYLHVQAKNALGNESPILTVSTILDNTAPTITGLANDTTPTKSKTWSWGSSESGDTYQFSIDQSINGVPTGDYVSTTSTEQIDGTGTYYLHIRAKDVAGNISGVTTVSAVLDNTLPVITLVGEDVVYTNIGDDYVDQGVTIEDNIDGIISGSMVADCSNVNTSIAGQYTVSYSVLDRAGNMAIASRVVNVADIEAPIITIKGDNPVSLNINEVYIDASATSTDNVDGDITNNIQTTSNVNTSVIGSYTVTYTVSDTSNNTSTSTRVVNVIARPSSGGGGYIISSPIVASLNTIIPSSGGEVTVTTANNTSVNILVPVNSVSNQTTFSATALNTSNINLPTINNTDTIQPLSNTVFQITALSNNVNVSSFNNNLTIILSIPSLSTTTDIGLYYLDEMLNKWTLIPTTTLDIVNKRVTFSIDHLIKFALFSIKDKPIVIDAKTIINDTNQISVIVKDNQIFKYKDDNKVYLLENGVKRWIKDETSFNKLGYKWSDIKEIDNTTSSDYKSGIDLVSTPNTFKFTKTLKSRSNNTDVIQLQTILKRLGYFSYPSITNFFGQQTYNALIKFQKANKLKATGIVDKATMGVLNKL